MPENDRSKREAFTEQGDDGETPAGHSIRDVGDRRQAEDEAPPVRRTQRDAPDSQEDETITRTSRGSGDSRPSADQSGNLSETGKGASNQTPTGQAKRPGPGTLPVGCARSAGSLLLIGILAVLAVVRLGGR